MSITISSTAFQHGAPIPARHTADGADVSPVLAWSGVPAGAKSLALTCDDPDAPGGTWVHWVLFNLPPGLPGLPDAVPTAEHVPNGAKQGRNDFGHTGYGGPAPPPGKPHRYFFKLYALDVELPLKPGATERELLQVMAGHVLAEGQWMGTYQRSR